MAKGRWYVRRRELLNPLGVVGALEETTYIGKRTTIALDDDGTLDVRRDDFKEGAYHVTLEGRGDWKAWTILELASERDQG